MGWFSNWFCGESTVDHGYRIADEYLRRTEKPPEMFIPKSVSLVGTVKSAERAYSKSSGTPFIKVMISFNEHDEGWLYLNRFDLTRAVLQQKWPEPQTKEDEDNLIASMVGRMMLVRCSVQAMPHDSQAFVNIFRFVKFMGGSHV